MRNSGFIAFLFFAMLIFIVNNVSTITKPIKDEQRNAESTPRGNGSGIGSNTLRSNSTVNYIIKLASFSAANATTIRTRTASDNKHKTMDMASTIATENTENTEDTGTLLTMMTSKLMTAHKIQISTAKPSNFNKNSLRQREEQQTVNQQREKNQKQRQQQSPQQRHYKHQYTLNNKHPPCDYAESTSSIVTSGAGNTTDDTNVDNNMHTTTTAQIDATAKGYKPLISLNTSNSVSTNNEVHVPLTLLSTSTSSPAPTPSPSPSSSPSTSPSPSSTFNVARNGFRDKINISNQRNEFTSEVDDDDYDGDVLQTNRHNNISFKAQVQEQDQDQEQAVQSYLEPLETNIHNRSSFSTKSVPAMMSSFFENVELAESRLSADKRRELLLHRRKRYLVFPEGSSFQLVFDLIIGIVDYTNYAILGITCSVAWELPSKPPSEIIENFRDKLNEGTYGLQRRNDSTADGRLQYVDTKINNPTKLTEPLATTAPKTLSSSEYKNQWKPQKYVDTRNWNYYEKEYAPQMAAAAPAASNFYEYKALHEYENKKNSENGGSTAPHLPLGDGFAEDQRKTLNDKTAKWQFGWNTPNPDKAYRKYDKKYDTKQNYEWRSNDKWKNVAPHVTADDWLQQRMSSNGDNDNLNNRDDYTADSVSFKERQQQQRNYANWRQNDNRWQHHTQRWHDQDQRWAQYEGLSKSWNSKSLNNPVTQYATPIYPDSKRTFARTGRQRKILKDTPKHRIFPVFGRKRRSLQSGKRSTRFELVLERIHFREHLQSRQKLYGKIEQVFQTRGHNGTACVLRALCETGQRHQNPLHHLQHSHQQRQRHYQRHHDDHQQQEPHSTAGQQSEPQSFITELLRAIFALPKDIRSREFESEALHSHAGSPSTGLHPNATHAHAMLQHEFEAHISRHYRDAHAYSGNCAERFVSCEHSIWNDGISFGGGTARAFKM